MAGRRPKPSKLKALEGKKIDTSDEPDPDVAVPNPPSCLDRVARKEWKRISKELAVIGLISEIDMTGLATYCQQFSIWFEASEHVKKTGLLVKSPNGYPVQNPYLSIANKAMERMVRILTEFGMTPASRSRIKMSLLPTGELPTGRGRTGTDGKWKGLLD